MSRKQFAPKRNSKNLWLILLVSIIVCGKQMESASAETTTAAAIFPQRSQMAEFKEEQSQRTKGEGTNVDYKSVNVTARTPSTFLSPLQPSLNIKTTTTPIKRFTGKGRPTSQSYINASSSSPLLRSDKIGGLSSNSTGAVTYSAQTNKNKNLGTTTNMYNNTQLDTNDAVARNERYPLSRQSVVQEVLSNLFPNGFSDIFRFSYMHETEAVDNLTGSTTTNASKTESSPKQNTNTSVAHALSKNESDEELNVSMSSSITREFRREVKPGHTEIIIEQLLPDVSLLKGSEEFKDGENVINKVDLLRIQYAASQAHVLPSLLMPPSSNESFAHTRRSTPGEAIVILDDRSDEEFEDSIEDDNMLAESRSTVHQVFQKPPESLHYQSTPHHDINIHIIHDDTLKKNEYQTLRNHKTYFTPASDISHNNKTNTIFTGIYPQQDQRAKNSPTVHSDTFRPSKTGHMPLFKGNSHYESNLGTIVPNTLRIPYGEKLSDRTKQSSKGAMELDEENILKTVHDTHGQEIYSTPWEAAAKKPPIMFDADIKEPQQDFVTKEFIPQKEPPTYVQIIPLVNPLQYQLDLPQHYQPLTYHTSNEKGEFLANNNPYAYTKVISQYTYPAPLPLSNNRERYHTTNSNNEKYNETGTKPTNIVFIEHEDTYKSSSNANESERIHPVSSPPNAKDLNQFDSTNIPQKPNTYIYVEIQKSINIHNKLITERDGQLVESHETIYPLPKSFRNTGDSSLTIFQSPNNVMVHDSLLTNPIHVLDSEEHEDLESKGSIKVKQHSNLPSENLTEIKESPQFNSWHKQQTIEGIRVIKEKDELMASSEKGQENNNNIFRPKDNLSVYYNKEEMPILNETPALLTALPLFLTQPPLIVPRFVEKQVPRPYMKSKHVEASHYVNHPYALKFVPSPVEKVVDKSIEKLVPIEVERNIKNPRENIEKYEKPVQVVPSQSSFALYQPTVSMASSLPSTFAWLQGYPASSNTPTHNVNSYYTKVLHKLVPRMAGTSIVVPQFKKKETPLKLSESKMNFTQTKFPENTHAHLLTGQRVILKAPHINADIPWDKKARYRYNFNALPYELGTSAPQVVTKQNEWLSKNVKENFKEFLRWRNGAQLKRSPAAFGQNLHVEYGFKPPLVPSLEIDEKGTPIIAGDNHKIGEGK